MAIGVEDTESVRCERGFVANRIPALPPTAVLPNGQLAVAHATVLNRVVSSLAVTTS
jgi:hypothetical protein